MTSALHLVSAARVAVVAVLSTARYGMQGMNAVLAAGWHNLHCKGLKLLRAPLQVSAIDPKWLVELAPRYFRQADAHKLSRRKRGAPPHAKNLCSTSCHALSALALHSQTRKLALGLCCAFLYSQEKMIIRTTSTLRQCAMQASGWSRCTTGTTTPWPGGCRVAAAEFTAARPRQPRAAGTPHFGAALGHWPWSFVACCKFFHNFLHCGCICTDDDAPC